MRILVTADWQADFPNLDLCEEAWEQVLEYAHRYKVDALVHAGDLKQSYNPVDLRVVHFWQKALERAVREGLLVFVDLGNHDRIGQYDDRQNWFSILRKSGVNCVDKPCIYNVGSDGQLAMLPFHRSKKKLVESAFELATKVEGDAVLIFHEDLLGSRYNQTGRKSEEGINAEILCPGVYRWCIGGHLHLQQKVNKNTWYVGSPFCHDWGEANQQKGYLLVDTDAGVEFLPSKIPGWFDPGVPGFYKPKTWAGARVRIRVECRSAVELVSRIGKARNEASDRYQGAEIVISPVFRPGNEKEGNIKTSDPDHVKIQQYVLHTCPKGLDSAKVTRYLQRKLEEVEGRKRTSNGVKFLWAEGKNFLSFKEVGIDFRSKGIIVIQGENRDRGGRSNGAGKTSLLQTIPVALFGTTFKGQKHDRWARRHAEGTASVALALADERGREVIIRRKRRPSQLRLWVDGKEQSSGLNPATKDGTQGLIEQLTGFTWQTLANSVYIDREVANAFLSGTKKQRTEVLAKFQNLERFAVGLEKIRGDQKTWVEVKKQTDSDIEITKERIAGFERSLNVLVAEQKREEKDLTREIAKREREYRQLQSKYKKPLEALSRTLKEIAREYEGVMGHLGALEQTYNITKFRAHELRQELARIEKSFKNSRCPTCTQLVKPELIASWKAEVEPVLLEVGKLLELQEKKIMDLKQQAARLDGEHDIQQAQYDNKHDRVTGARLALQQLTEYQSDRERRKHQQGDLYENTLRRKQKAEKQLREAAEYLKIVTERQRFLEYAEKAFSRDGIPAFLNALMAPELNAGAVRYAELFCDGAVQVRFEIENGEFVPIVINATGGESIEDQSTGERALAGLIASFALREAAPKCNLLILDEPGEGLDPQNARQFAAALKELDYGAVYVTTHNAHMLAELEQEQTVTVVKRNGVSKVL